MFDERLDPEVQAILAEIEEHNGPALETLPVDEARALAADGLKPHEGQREPVASVEDMRIAGPLGPIPIRVYAPASERPRPALVYFHGGGWVVCDLDTHDAVCRMIANCAGATVVAVDYRRAPEHKFPAAVDDAYAATQWVHKNAYQLAVDPARIAVGGDSAGGNLAAVVSLNARNRFDQPLALQVLIYPVTNLASFDTASYREFAAGYHLTQSAMEWFRDNYLASADAAGDPYVSPLLASDLRGLPPALVINAECDVLRDEGEAYAERLKHAGVPVTAIRYPGMIHPFFSMPGTVRQARKAIEQVAAAVAGMPRLRG